MSLKRVTSLVLIFFFSLSGFGEGFLVHALSPSWVSNGVFFFDGQDTDNNGLSWDEPLNNDPITNLIDKFNANTWSQLWATKKPLYKTNSINSYPSLFFDGSNDLLNIEDNLEISIGTGYTDKSYAMIIKTSADITSLQTIYDEGTKEKWFSFQIEASHLYASAYNSLDWSIPNQYKTIDLWVITANTVYTIIFVYDQGNDFVKGYLDGSLQGTLNSISLQKTHGACRFITSFDCNIYSTGWTIALGSTKNDTIKLSDNSQIVGFEGNHFYGNIWEISSWNHALTSSEVNGIQDYLVIKWWIDNTAPVITSTNISSGSLLPGGNHDIVFNYNDTHTGSTGIDSSSDSITLQKRIGAAWGADISVTGFNLGGKTVTSSGATYPTNDLGYGKYRATFNISDNAGNTSLDEELVFYIDQPQFIISTGSLDIGTVNNVTNSFSPEITITVKTVGAGFDVVLNKNTTLTYSGETIPDWDGTIGFGYDQDVYTGSISLIWVDENIGTQVASINTNGDLNTYTYKIKVGILINALEQAGGNYSGKIDFWINLNY